MNKLVILRHGETKENAAGVHQGASIGGTLSARGGADIALVGSVFLDVGLMVDEFRVSPSSRCQQTFGGLEYLARASGAHTEPRLGAKVGSTGSGPGGESSRDVQARYVRVITEMLCAPLNTGVVIGHGNGIAGALVALLDRSFDEYWELVPTSAAAALLRRQGQRWTVDAYGIPPKELAAQLRKHWLVGA